jgi:prephenate dehydrogenase
MDTLVVGAGAMGQWLGRVVRQEFDEPVTLTYYDTDIEKSRTAAANLGGKYSELTGKETFDAVSFAVPIPAIAEAIETHAPRAESVVFDVTGTMSEPVRAMAGHAPDCERLSLHPLFAPANEPGNVPAVVDEPGPRTDSILAALEARGNTVFETTPNEHDEMMDTVQAKTHATVLAFALAAEEVPPEFHTPVSRPLFELAGQVTEGESRVYADIQAAFDGADEVATAAARLSEADRETFEQLYENAARVLGDDTEHR